MTKIDIAKNIVTGIVGTSVTFTVQRVIVNNTNPETIIQKAETMVGAAVVGSMVAEQSKIWTGKKVDELVTWWQNNVKK